jgi:hypothetical protein
MLLAIAEVDIHQRKGQKQLKEYQQYQLHIRRRNKAGTPNHSTLAK